MYQIEMNLEAVMEICVGKECVLIPGILKLAAQTLSLNNRNS